MPQFRYGTAFGIGFSHRERRRRRSGSGAVGVRMNVSVRGTLEKEGLQALLHMEEALRLLDGCEATTSVGAQLDHAICRLRDVLADAGVDGPPRVPDHGSPPPGRKPQ